MRSNRLSLSLMNYVPLSNVRQDVTQSDCSRILNGLARKSGMSFI